MKEKLLPILIVLFIIFSVYLFIEVDKINKRLSTLNNLTVEINAAGDSALVSLNKFRQKLENELNGQFGDNLNHISQTIIDKKLKAFEYQLKNIQKKINDERTVLENLKSKKRRELLDLPEQVDLDDLFELYKDSKSVSFDTKKGSIYFSSYNIEIAVILSVHKPAWIRIGKENSTENSELIKAWLKESANAKFKQGYKLIYNRTRETDYGEYTEKYYKKGDMYFQTYFQYGRVQGTYGRYSLQYKYYVETGSVKRKELYFKEQYNSKLGS